jgi:hypothetical protein
MAADEVIGCAEHGSDQPSVDIASGHADARSIFDHCLISPERVAPLGPTKIPVLKQFEYDVSHAGEPLLFLQPVA